MMELPRAAPAPTQGDSGSHGPSEGRRFLRGAASLFFLFALGLPGFGQSGPSGQAGASERSGPAILASGTAASRGLPGFGQNGIPCIAGAYRLPGAGSDAPTVRVWATREALYAVPNGWKARRIGPYGFLEEAVGETALVPVAGDRPVLALSLSQLDDPALGLAEPKPPAYYCVMVAKRPFPAGGQGAFPEDWSVVLAFPLSGASELDVERTARLAFCAAFMDRFSYFLSIAKLPEDVSFPATLSLR